MHNYKEIVEKFRTNNFEGHVDKSTSIKMLIDIANNMEGRIALCQTGICDFICEVLLHHEEGSVEYITDLCVLIGYLGISDTYRPILFKNNVVDILVCALQRVGDDDILKHKLKIVESIKCLWQEKMIVVQFIEAGILSHLCHLLTQVCADAEKKFVSFCIYWISYLAYDIRTAVECGCIDLMYKAAESISNKPIQSHILLDMHYFINHVPVDSRYPIYGLWRTDFQTYLKS
jgi:hypothetical protein